MDRNIHNVVVHSLCIGKINARRVVGKIRDEWGRPRQRMKMRKLQGREWLSIVECISAGATYIAPLIFLKVSTSILTGSRTIYHRICILLIPLLGLTTILRYGGYKRYLLDLVCRHSHPQEVIVQDCLYPEEFHCQKEIGVACPNIHSQGTSQEVITKLGAWSSHLGHVFE